MDANGDGTDERIRLGRLRFLGAEATTLVRDLDRFVDHAEAYGYALSPEAFRAARELRVYLEDFARDALF